MLDQLASIIANGTTAFNWGYAPWLPFYNFFPMLILVSLLVTVYWFEKISVARAILWGTMTLTSGLSAEAVVFVLWVKLDLKPSQVFFWWSVNWILIMIGQMYHIRKNERVKEQIKDMEERENL